MTYVINFTEQDLLEAEKKLQEQVVDNIDDLLKQLTSIDKKYSTEYQEPEYNLPESLGLEKLEYTGMNEQEIYEAAKNSLLEKELNALAKIESTESKGIQSVESQINKLLEDNKQKQKLVEDNSTQGQKSAQNNAIRRGLARSSIIQQQLSDLERDTEQQLGELEMYKDSSLYQYEQQIQQLKQQKQNALQSFELVQAADLQAKIDSLTAKAQTEMNNIQKYNNTVDEKETKYVVSREEGYRKAHEDEWKRVAEMLRILGEYGPQGIEKTKLDKKLDAAQKYFMALPPETAYKLLVADTSLRAHLGQYYGYLEAMVKSRLSK